MPIAAEEVRRFLVLNAPLEGRVAHMYLDTHDPPLVTTGVGNLIDPIDLALPLPWQVDGKPATQDEIAAEWRKLKRNPQVASLLAPYQAQRLDLRLRLTAEAIDALVQRRLDADDAALRRVREFMDMDEWPIEARLALRSMAWAMGPGFAYQGRWPRFRTACLGRDWSAAAENCRMREDDSTHAAHNNVNASLFRVAAARVGG